VLLRLNCMFGRQLGGCSGEIMAVTKQGPLLASVGAGLMIAGSALGAEEPAKATSKVERGGETLTVFATLAPSDPYTFPGSVSVIERAQIEDRQPSSTSDLFDAVPGVLFDGGPRRTGETPTVRGLGGAGVLVLFDGVRNNFFSGHDGRFFIEPDLLEAAEIVRGPSSALYGSGAVGGVFAFRTLNAADLLADGETVGYRLKGGYQSVDKEWMTGANVFGRSSDNRFDGLASITYRNGDDIKLGNGRFLEARDRIVSGLVKGSARLTEDLKASIAWIAYDGKTREPNNGQGVATAAPDNALVDKTITSNTLRGGFSYSPSNFIDANLFGFHTDTEVEEDEVASTRVETRTLETTGVSFNSRTRFTLGEATGLVFTYGAEHFRDEQEGTDNASPDGARGGVPDAEADTTGVFLQGELESDTAIGRFRLIPGFRYDSFKSNAPAVARKTDDSALSPKVGTSYEPVPWLLLFGNYAKSFRAPNFNETFADGNHFVIPLGPGLEAPNSFIANPDLGPETSKGFEVGAGFNFSNVVSEGDRLKAKGSYYRSNVEDLIDLEVDFALAPGCFGGPGPCNAGTSRYINAHRAELHGVEIEGSYDSTLVFATVAFSSIEGINRDTGLFIGTLSPDRVNLDAGVKLPKLDARLGMRGEFASDFDKVNTPGESRDSYAVFDLYLAWIPAAETLKGLRVDLGVDNVGDKNYERVFAGVPEPGRNVKFSIGWTRGF